MTGTGDQALYLKRVLDQVARADVGQGDDQIADPHGLRAGGSQRIEPGAGRFDPVFLGEAGLVPRQRREGLVGGGQWIVGCFFFGLAFTGRGPPVFDLCDNRGADAPDLVRGLLKFFGGIRGRRVRFQSAEFPQEGLIALERRVQLPGDLIGLGRIARGNLVTEPPGQALDVQRLVIGFF